jgi:hypothetical protein
MNTSSASPVFDDNLNLVANAVELSTRVILHAMGNDASSSIGGAPVTKAALADAVATRLQAKMMAYAGVSANAQ